MRSPRRVIRSRRHLRIRIRRIRLIIRRILYGLHVFVFVLIVLSPRDHSSSSSYGVVVVFVL